MVDSGAGADQPRRTNARHPRLRPRHQCVQLALFAALIGCHGAGRRRVDRAAWTHSEPGGTAGTGRRRPVPLAPGAFARPPVPAVRQSSGQAPACPAPWRPGHHPGGTMGTARRASMAGVFGASWSMLPMRTPAGCCRAAGLRDRIDAGLQPRRDDLLGARGGHVLELRIGQVDDLDHVVARGDLLEVLVGERRPAPRCGPGTPRSCGWPARPPGSGTVPGPAGPRCCSASGGRWRPGGSCSGRALRGRSANTRACRPGRARTRRPSCPRAGRSAPACAWRGSACGRRRSGTRRRRRRRRRVNPGGGIIARSNRASAVGQRHWRRATACRRPNGTPGGVISPPPGMGPGGMQPPAGSPRGESSRWPASRRAGRRPLP